MILGQSLQLRRLLPHHCHHRQHGFAKNIQNQNFLAEKKIELSQIKYCRLLSFKVQILK